MCSLTRIASGVPHVSVYMLEVDEESRLGRELIADGTRYHAHFVPDEDTTAELYEQACARLNAAGIFQYEISNFARDRSPDHQITRSPDRPIARSPDHQITRSPDVWMRTQASDVRR